MAAGIHAERKKKRKAHGRKPISLFLVGRYARYARLLAVVRSQPVGIGGKKRKGAGFSLRINDENGFGIYL